VCDQPTSKVREERGRERRGVERGKGKTEEGRGWEKGRDCALLKIP